MQGKTRMYNSTRAAGWWNFRRRCHAAATTTVTLAGLSLAALSLTALSIAALASATALAHDGHGELGGDKQAATLGTGLVLPDIEGAKPWSNKPALTDPNRFSIAIMTDRTGGHRPGIWMKAVERVNWLRPDFVVSVGDLIEGYTEDEIEIERQWTEFLGFIDQMQMKFFFVPGNHDLTNPKMHQIWQEKFGREWYSFDYKGVHFVCLNSEDPVGRIGDQQLEWLEQDLQANGDARWTLLFFHKPIWVYSERDLQAGNPDSTNWSKVATLLGDRPHTVFAGHVHHYVQYERNGHHYYTLATTGGGSQLRGIPYGEFDHIAWLTMEEDGPRVANLMLDGIHPASAVTEQSIQRFRSFLQATQIVVEPLLISDEVIQTGEIRFGLQNGFDLPVTLSGKIEGLPLVGLSMESQSIELRAEPGQGLQRIVQFEMKQPVDLRRFRATSMLAKIATEEDNPLRAEWTIPVIIDKQYEIIPQTITVDGNLDEWGDAWWSTGDMPELTGAIGQWNGPADCSYDIAMRYDDNYIYCAAKVADDQVIDGDRITFVIDPRLQLTRLQANSLGRETLSATIAAPTSPQWSDCEATDYRGRPAGGVRAMGRRTKSGYEVELSFPIERVVEIQGKEWPSIQAGVRVMDVDSPQDEPLEVLWRTGSELRDNRQLAHLLRR
jgi:predicted phosphodiesterase